MNLHSLTLLALILLVSMPVFECAYCHGKPGAYFVNNEPIWKQSPRFLKSHKYGKLF